MDNDRKKAMRLCSELVGYFVEHHAQHLSIDFIVTGEHIAITISSPVPARPHELEKLKTALEEPRRPEMDEYYESLLGGESEFHGYHLMGAMVDESEVSYENGLLFISVMRRH